VETQVDVIGTRVRLLRVKREIDAGVLADKANISKAHVYRIESGERPNAAAVTVGRLARALGTSADYLIGLTDDPSPHTARPIPQDPHLRARLARFEERFAQLDPDDQASVLDEVFALLQFRGRVDGEEDGEKVDEVPEAGTDEAPVAQRPGAA